MNVYVFNDCCSGAMYGVGTYIRELTTSLKNDNINICVINLFADVQKIKIEDESNIKYWYFPKPIQEQRTSSKIRQWELYYRNVIYLFQLHIKDKKDLIFHLNYNYSSSFLKALREAFDCKIVTCIHYLDWCLKTNGNISDFRRKLAVLEKEPVDDTQKTIYTSFLKEKSFFENVDRIICLSEFTRNILQHEYKILDNKIDVVYNGLADVKPYCDNSAFCIKYRMPEIPIMLFVGRVDYRKGLMYALRAFRKVLDIQPCHFIIAGNGDFDLLMKECEDIWMYITWTGKLNHSKLYNIYSIADIGILPSFAEQCSYVAIEMMMHGVPLIVSTSTGLNEMVKEGYNGLHVPIEERPDEVEIDITLLANQILYLLQNTKARKLMGLNARNQYEKCYRSELMRGKMLNIYQSMFKKG